MTDLDPRNPVVRLCVAGVEAERSGRATEAAARYAEARDAATDELGRAIAAHYLARVQEDEEARLRFNRAAVDHALAAGAAATGFLPSLYLNLGHSHEQLGQVAVAESCYQRAAEAINRVANDAVAASLVPAIRRARARVRTAPRATR